MRFKQFLEAQIKPYEHTPANGEELVKLLREHCGHALESAGAGDYIYRGTRSDLVAGVYNPGSGERKSQNTSNFYTNFLDSNPANNAFPKRGKSFICSTRKMKAHGYVHSFEKHGTLVVCFPFNETDIAVVNEDDMWDLKIDFGEGFARGFNIVDVNDFWIDLLEDNYGDLKDAATLSNIRSFIRKCPEGKIVKLLQKEGFLHGIDRVKNSDREIVDKFIDALPEAYSYKSLGCTLTKADNIASADGEVWFSGKCILIPINDWDDLKEEFGL